MAEKLKIMRTKLQEKLKKLFAHTVLTLRGEIVVASAGIANITKEDFNTLKLEENIQQLKKELSGAKITVNYGVCDVTIRLFVYQVKVTDGVFDRLQEVFEDIALGVYNDKLALSLRLDVLGEINSFNGKKHVRFLNKREQVAYRLLDDTEAAETALTRIKKKIF